MDGEARYHVYVQSVLCTHTCSRTISASTESRPLLVPNYVSITLSVLRNLCVNEALGTLVMADVDTSAGALHMHQSGLITVPQDDSKTQQSKLLSCQATEAPPHGCAVRRSAFWLHSSEGF